MSDYNTGEVEGTDLEPRTECALTEYMTVLPLGGNIYSVTTQSGSEYRVDAREDRFTCPDHKHRDVRCKHQRRVAFATGDRPIPTDFDGVDEQLGEHVDESPCVAAADGGEDINEDAAVKYKPGYTFHIESQAQGGARYVRCEGCGREVIPADPDLLHHPDWCPNKN